MRTFLRFILFLSLAVWLGGIIFFSFVVAPNVFSVLTPLAGGRHLAGDIVNRTLGALQWIGLACGVVFLLSSSALLKKIHSAQNVLVAVMMALTLVLIFHVTPRMEGLRSSVADLDKSPAAQSEFNSFHKQFVVSEIGVLLLGLSVVWLVTKNPD